MKKGNRFIALLLSFTMLVTMIPSGALTAFAAGDYDSTIKGTVVLEDGTGLPDVSCERDVLMSHFAVHISPIYYLLLPFYALFPSPLHPNRGADY